jgi:beta-N-acetylhexosaminidase
MKKMQLLILTVLLSFVQTATAQGIRAKAWVDSVFNTLSDDERIAQLMVVRLSTINNGVVSFYDQQVRELVRKYNIGGICLFQGAPSKQAAIMNSLQAEAKTPIMMCIDAEWGLGMRVDSILNYPFQLSAGAVDDAALIYEMGKAIGEQCRRMGLQVNYAPVVDVNNNPNNPVIGYRSFGEDKYKVGLFGTQIMKGMQDAGIMACAKHFPGHGDTETDSHYDLPVINKSRSQLDSLELYPFREIFKNNVGSVMVAHLFIPSIDNTANRPTSLSPNNINGLLRNDLNYQGLTFTDALEMKGVAKFYPGGEAAVQSLIAGNDMLCLPKDVKETIKKLRKAIKKKRITWEEVYAKTRKVLLAKYQLGLQERPQIDLNNLVPELNSRTLAVRKKIFDHAITLLKNERQFIPFKKPAEGKTAYVAIGVNADNLITQKMRSDLHADVFFFDFKQPSGRIPTLMNLLQTKYDKIVVGLHNYSRRPANNFGMSADALQLLAQLSADPKTLVCAFGNPYAAKYLCHAKNVLLAYEDDAVAQQSAWDVMSGALTPKGKLPVTVCDAFQYGMGLTVKHEKMMPHVAPADVALNGELLSAVIDSVATDAVDKGAAPGCVVLVAKDGKVAYEKAFGFTTYEKQKAQHTDFIFDMASVTKICATNLAVMKLYDEGKISLQGRLGDYLPWVKGSNKENLVIKDILLHQARLKAWIPFYKEVIYNDGKPMPTVFSSVRDEQQYKIPVASSMYMRGDWVDTMYKRMLESPLEAPGKYIYSDNDFIFLGKMVEQLSGQQLDEYVKTIFYEPMGLSATGFNPLERFAAEDIVPTEQERYFRLQTLQGHVHDPGAAMFGGVAGHAGLFSTAADLAMIMQMLLNGGEWNGRRYLKPETVELFTAYHSSISRRGLGFDKPEKDNDTRNDPYPCRSASPATFGHTGFTGTCVWADPRYNLVYVFLSNRVHPMGGDNTKLLKMNVRSNIQEAIYRAME